MDSRFLQLSDSAFPSGAFSQSFGLETAIAEGRVRTNVALQSWLQAYLHNLASLDGAAIALLMAGRATCAELDRALTAALFADELRAASARLARATLDAFAAMQFDVAGLVEYRTAIEAGTAHGHHALACALGYRAIGVPPAAGVGGYASSALAGLAAVAARLIPLGQRDVGATLWALRDQIERAARDACTVRSTEAFATRALESEIDAMRHSLLDARMFAS